MNVDRASANTPLEIPIIPRRLLTVLVCLLGLALTSCNTGNGVGSTANLTRVRVINLVPNAAAISVQLDSTSLVTGLQFEQVTQYLTVDPGPREIKVSADGGTTNIIDISRNLAVAVDYTFVVYGPVETINQTILIDTTTLIPNGGTFDLRVTNVSTIPAVDLYLTPAGTDLTVTAPVVSGISPGATSIFTVF